MSNINWNQMLNSFVNNVRQMSLNNLQNNNLSQTGSEQYIAQTILPKTTQQVVQTTAELALLNQTQSISMLKELLNLPKNFDMLINQLNVSNQSSSELKGAMLLLSSTSDLSLISSLLQNNSKNAMSNLYQMLAQYNKLGVTLNDEQLSQISKMISFISASSASDVQSLKTIMLLYLPWLPLTDPDIFKLEISKKNSDDSISSDDSVTILIATQNYGNIQVNIYKTNEDGIKIEAVTSQTFPQKEFVTLMKEEGIKHNININFELSTKEVFNKKKNEKTETQLYMNTSPGVNPFLLIISNNVIKNVHIIDTKENIRELRKEKVNKNNGEN